MKATIITVNDKNYKIRFPINAYADYEEMCRKSIDHIVGENAEVSISDLRRLLFLGLCYGSDDFEFATGIKVAGDMIDASIKEHEDLQYLTSKVDEAIKASALPIMAAGANDDSKKK